MDAAIHLTRFSSRDLDLPPAIRQAWALEVEARGQNMDSEIFVHHLGLPDGFIPNGDKFECVASVNQMLELPRTQGVSLSTTTGIPFYRTNHVRLVFRTPVEAELAWQRIVKDTNSLVENWIAAQNLLAVETATLTGQLATIKDYAVNPPYRHYLSYHPAGTPGVDGSGFPIITSPDASKAGWLPVSTASSSWIKPPGAWFYYNLDKDPTLRSHWPPKEPFSGNTLGRNGLDLPYEIVYTIDANTIWWLKFRTDAVADYRRLTGQPEDIAAPWPSDYISPSSPGVVPTILTLTLFL